MSRSLTPQRRCVIFPHQVAIRTSCSLFSSPSRTMVWICGHARASRRSHISPLSPSPLMTLLMAMTTSLPILLVLTLSSISRTLMRCSGAVASAVMSRDEKILPSIVRPLLVVLHIEQRAGRRGAAAANAAPCWVAVRMVLGSAPCSRCTSDAELSSPPDPPSSAFTARSMLHSPSLLFTTLPTSRRTNINTHRFRLAIRHLLNLPVTDSMPDECKCGAIFANEPSHFHSCPLNRKVGTYKRHNAIARTIKEICDEIGIPCQWNPRLEDEKGNRTMPDLLMSAHDGDVEIDVSVCSVWCKTNRAMDDPIGSREKVKRSKYEATRTANGHAFIPAVCDSIGRLGPGMRQIIGLLVSHHNNTATSHTLNPKLREHIIRGLTIQLHEGNALVDITGLQYYPAARPLTRLPHPNRPPPPPSPPIPHHTLCSKLASPEDIPSTIDASSSSSPRLSSPTYIDPNCPTEMRNSSSSSDSESGGDDDDHGDEGSDDDDGLIEHEEKRTGPSSLSLSSTASSSATLLFARRSQPLPKTGDLPHKANLHSSSIVDSPTSLSLSSSLSLRRIPLFPRLHVPLMIPATLPPPGAPQASSTPLHRPPDD